MEVVVVVVVVVVILPFLNHRLAQYNIIPYSFSYSRFLNFTFFVSERHHPLRSYTFLRYYTFLPNVLGIITLVLRY